MAAGGGRRSSPAPRSARTYPADEAAGGVRRDRALRRRDRARATCRSRAATSRASTSRWSSCTRTRKSLLDSNHAGRQLHLGQGQGRHRHRRRRHRHRLRRHVAAPRLPEPGAVRDPAAAARRARGRQSLAAVAARSTSSTTARKRRRRCSAPTRATTSIRHQALRRRRGGQREGASHTVEIEWVKRRTAASRMKEIPGTREDLAGRRWCCWRWASSAPRSDGLLDQLGVDARRARQRRRRRRQARPACPGVFAAGDMRRGQSLVVWAIARGRAAAARASTAT